MPTFTDVTHFWTSSSGTWDDTSSWDTGLIPEDGDKVVFDPALSSQDLITMPVYATDLFAFVVREKFAGNLGAQGNPVILSADKIVMAGTGAFHFSCGQPDASNTTTDLIVIRSPNAVNAFTMDSEDGNNTQITTVIVKKGAVTVSSTCGLIATLSLDFDQNPVFDARVTLPSGSFGITDIKMAAGVLNCSRSVTRSIQNGGQWTQQNSITTHNHTGGNLFYNSASALTEAHLMGGTIDLTKSRHNKTITALYKYKRGTLKYDENLHSVTFIDTTGEGLATV